MAFRTTYKTVEELQAAVDSYFASCDEKDARYGQAGLALALHVSMSTLRRWRLGEVYPEFQDVILEAYLRIQNQLETSPIYEAKGMPAIAMFALKQECYGGYTDKGDTSGGKLDVHVHVGQGVTNADME